MKQIPLTQGKFAIVDDEDYDYLMQWKWTFDGRYATRSSRVNGKHVKTYMHRQLLDTGLKIDHFDNDKLNYTRSNLRPATDTQNVQNRSKSKNKSSEYKGVSANKKTGKWEAHITINYKKVYLGLFHTAIDAAKAYNAKALECFGEFSHLNQVAA